MSIGIRRKIADLPLSVTLRANQAALRRRSQGHSVLHMGFGQSPFPVHPLLAAALSGNADSNHYEHVAGLRALRDTALHYFAETSGVVVDDYELVVAPGSKLMLLALQMAIEGDVLLPIPSWVSYAPQAAMLDDRVIPVDTDLSDCGYRIDAQVLADTIAQARADGANPTKLILNTPNNPTGLCIPESDHAMLAAVCAEHDFMIISDEIYGLVTFDGPQRSIAATNPAITAITTGLSKHLSLGGWRIGFGLIPKGIPGLYDALCAIASETWSSVSSPMQHAALFATSGNPEIEDYIRRCTAIHAAVARYAAGRLRGGGLKCAMPSGAFYLWPDFSAMSGTFAGCGITDSQDLADALLDRHDVLALPGDGFGASAEQLCLRLSVCDYDGGAALVSCRGLDDPSVAIESFAPRVVAACDAICEFVEEGV